MSKVTVVGAVLSAVSFVLVLLGIWTPDVEVQQGFYETAWLFGVPGLVLGVAGALWDTLP